MKLSKTSWLLIALGVFIIALISLGALRSQQVRQQNQLGDKLALAALKLNDFQTEELSYQRQELERKLSQITSQSESARTTLSQPVDSITASTIIFDIAEASNVALTEIGSAGLTSNQLQGVPLSVLPFTLVARGDVAGLVSFITGLNSGFTTGVVNSVEISIPETAGGEASATIKMVIYAYQGS